MQFQEHAPLTSAMAAAIGDSDKNEIVVQLENYRQQIFSLLTSYHYADRGSVHEVSFKSEQVEIITNQSVEFNTAYRTEKRYACDGIAHHYAHIMRMRIDVHHLNQTLTLTGENWPERDGEEF